MFVLKKTGIIDEFIGADDVYDNHFLYVQVRVQFPIIKLPNDNPIVCSCLS